MFATIVWMSVLAGGAGWIGLKWGARKSAKANEAEFNNELLGRRFQAHETTANPRIQIRPLITCALCVLYILSPIDLLPEAILGPFGLPDDALALFGAIRNYKQAFNAPRLVSR